MCYLLFIKFSDADFKVEIITGTDLGAGTNDFVYIEIFNQNNQNSGFSSVGTGEGYDDFENGR